MEMFTICPKCDNTYIGYDEGSLEINDDNFKRTCKCGWSIEIIEKEIYY
jgi:hypothetical protein